VRLVSSLPSLGVIDQLTIREAALAETAKMQLVNRVNTVFMVIRFRD